MNDAPSANGTPALAGVLLDDRAVFDLESARQLLGRLGIKPSCIGREVRLGRLRVSKRGGKYIVLGAWLREWIEGGEKTARHRAKAEAATD